MEDKIKSIRYIGKQKTMDITIEDKIHVFYGNGIAVSNSHSVEYGAITGAEFWLKHNYPVEFITALINNSKSTGGRGGLPEHVKYVNYARQRGYDVLSPSVNTSQEDCTIEGDKIRFGLGRIKQVGKAAGLIVKNAPYTGIEDFFTRLPKSKVNKRVIENLIAAGAFDEFDERNKLMDQLYSLRKEKELPEDLNDEAWRLKEIEVAGICLSQDPIVVEYKEYIEKKGYFTISGMGSVKDLMVFGRIEGHTEKRSKTGNIMRVYTLSDDINTIQFYVWKDNFNYVNSRLTPKTICAIGLRKFPDGYARFYNGTPIHVIKGGSKIVVAEENE